MVGLVVAVDRNHALCYHVSAVVTIVAVLVLFDFYGALLSAKIGVVTLHTLSSQLGLGTPTLPRVEYRAQLLSGLRPALAGPLGPRPIRIK